MTEIGRGGTYEATVYYTCKDQNVGTTIRLSAEEADSAAEQPVSEPFDPPLYDKSQERVEQSHYFVKDFKPLVLGKLELQAGRDRVRLSASKFVGDEAIDVHSIELKRLNRSH